MIYDFECPNCKSKAELQCLMKEYDEKKETMICSLCNTKMKRVFKGFGGLVFNANGFYCIDKREK